MGNLSITSITGSVSSSEGQGSKLYSAAAINNTQQYICNMLSVLPSTSSNVTTISQVLPSSITKYHQILPCSICTQYCMSVWHAVLVLSHGDYYKIVQSITKYYQILPNSTKYCQILQGLSGAQCCCNLRDYFQVLLFTKSITK